MKKKRCTYLGLSIVLTMGLCMPSLNAFAEAPEEETLIEGSSQTDSELLVDGTDGNENRLNVVLKSYNPGFSDPYVGEFFEIVRLSKNYISLAGLSVIYETSSGNEYPVYAFLDEDEMVGESLLFRLASSDEVKNSSDTSLVADVTYTRNMSQSAGRIKLNLGNETIDSLCWGLKETGCLPAFKTGKTANPTTLVREITEEEIGEFDFTENYTPFYDPEKPGLFRQETVEEIIEPKCRSLEFMEIYTYYESSAAEQFIELFNAGDEDVTMDGCFISYRNKNYALFGTINARSLKAVYPFTDFGIVLTKNPTSSNQLSLIDTDGETVDKVTYYSGQRKGVSLALVGNANEGTRKWMQTYNPTPGSENIYQQFKTCPVGKVINLETGNCINDTTLAVATVEACPSGKYRNPLTGRCKSYETATSTALKPCAEGYERNPETNRCRKIVQNTGADYPIASNDYNEKTEMTSIWTITTIIIAGVGYIVFQYKEELAGLFAKKHVKA